MIKILKKRILDGGQEHNYQILTEETRPQDSSLGDLTGWKFKSYEHGGEFPDEFPLVIEAIDPEGRSCTYHPIYVDGKAVNSISFGFPNSMSWAPLNGV